MANERKKAFIRHVVRRVQEMVAIADDVADLENEYFDNGYNSGGGDAVTDGDMAIHDLTAAQFGSLITVMQQFDKLMTNQVVTQGDYIANLNAARRSPGV